MTLHELHEIGAYLADVAWLWPGVTISVLVAGILGPRLAVIFGLEKPVAIALILGLGLIVSATLTPSSEAINNGTIGLGSCDLDRIGPASVSELVGLGDPTFNVLLFVPLGVAIGLMPSLRAIVIPVLAAVALPFAIEAIQLFATRLDRACQSSDVSDNLTGLAIGLAIGLVFRAVRHPRVAASGDEAGIQS